MAEHGTRTRYQAGCRCAFCRDANAAAARRLRLGGLAEGDPRHGTESGYMNHACRCALCRNARWLAIEERRGRLAPDDSRHGSMSTYNNWGCRCDACRLALASYQAVLRRRRASGPTP